MSDLIDRQKAYEVLTDYYHHRENIQHEALREALNRVPSAEPERKTGAWIEWERDSGVYDLKGVRTWAIAYRCSECGFIHWVIEDFGIYSFCPNCGSDMTR